MPLSDHEADIIDHVEQHGWHCTSVLEGEGCPAFTYSVGFWETLKAPELIVIGLPGTLAHGMLWEAFRQIRDGRNTVKEHERWSDLIDGFDCISRPVHPSQVTRDYFNSAMWYRRHRAGPDAVLTAFQLFWPGKTTGLFPWENGCSEEVRTQQPLLYLPRETGLA